MRITDIVERIFSEQTEAFAASPVFRRLEARQASREEVESLLANIFVTHNQSPKVMAFLYAVAPPAGADMIKHNLMEEMGLEAGEVSHPELLRQVLMSAGFTIPRIEALERKSMVRIRGMACDPLLYGTLMETGLAVLLEASAFEWMLSRLAERMGNIVAAKMGMGRGALAWFYHHGEVDIRHASEALQVIKAYCAYYAISDDDLRNIAEITFRENIFQRQYLGGKAEASINAHP